MTNIPSHLDWFTVVRSGDDLLVPRAAATWFGGDHDPEDNGQTASGVPTKGIPSLRDEGMFSPISGLVQFIFGQETRDREAWSSGERTRLRVLVAASRRYGFRNRTNEKTVAL